MLVPAWVVLVTFWGITSATRLLYRDPVAKRKARDLFAGSVTQTTVTLLYFAYPALCVAALRLFPCLDISGVGRVWEGSVDVSCEDGSAHEGIATSAGTLAVALGVVGIPVALSVAVWRSRKTLWTRKTKSKLGTCTRVGRGTAPPSRRRSPAGVTCGLAWC